MHLHVICSFPGIPLLGRELVSIVPAKVDGARRVFFRWRGGRNSFSFYMYTVFGRSLLELSTGQGQPAS
jgi:hypothetical protein